MAVSKRYREFVLEQLERIAPVTARAMFGGVGLYCEGLFFALMDDDTLYFKVDDSNRSDFEKVGMGPFSPFGDESHVMQYYEVPAEVIEDEEQLSIWMKGALAVAARAATKKKPKKKRS
jgi:DNA transformation protein and related proteins